MYYSPNHVIMRKYYQLLLVVVTVISVVTLLFYRNEYLKLRYVLQVLDFFGNVEEDDSECVSLMKNLTKEIDNIYMFSEPRPVWTYLDRFYLLSTFWIENESEMYSKTIVIGPWTSFPDMKCRLWFEKGDILVFKEGELKYDSHSSKAGRNSKLKYYTLKCRVKEKHPLQVPYGVLFSSKNNHSRFLPMYYHKPEPVSESLLCVRPDYAGIAKLDAIEYLSYYSAIGVKHIVIYDIGIQHGLFPFLESAASNKNSTIFKSITVLNWNFPIFDDVLEEQIFKDDCLSRSYGKANIVLLGSWGTYLTPKVPQNLPELLSLYKNSAFELKSSVSLACCTNIKDDPDVNKTAPLALRKTHCQKSDNKEIVIVISNFSGENKQTLQQPVDTVITRVYKECTEKTPQVDNYPLHLNRISDFVSHKLIHLWRINLQTKALNDLNEVNIENNYV